MTLAHPLGIQLYSGRKFPPVEAQLATVARHGFTHVETFAPFYDDVEATKRMLDAHGLSARSGHFSVAMLEGEGDRAVDVARQAGGRDRRRALSGAGRTSGRRSKAGKALGARLLAIEARLSAAGLRFAWHNHDFEFKELADGSLPIKHLLGDRILWEADLAWVVRGGADPRHWIERYRGRIPLVHVKDIAPAGEKADEDGWADVGAGTHALVRTLAAVRRGGRRDDDRRA